MKTLIFYCRFSIVKTLNKKTMYVAFTNIFDLRFLSCDLSLERLNFLFDDLKVFFLLKPDTATH